MCWLNTQIAGPHSELAYCEQWEFTFLGKSLTPTPSLICITFCNDNPVFRPKMLTANLETVQVEVGNMEKLEMLELIYNEDPL